MALDRAAVVKKAEAFVREGKLDQAAAQYRALLDDHPGDSSAANALGDLYARLGDPARAIEQYTNLGESEWVQGFSAKAAAFYKKALKVDQNCESALVRLGEIAASQSLFADATRHWTRLGERRRLRGDAAGEAEVAGWLADLQGARSTRRQATSVGMTPRVEPSAIAVPAAEPAPAEEFTWLERSEPESQPSGGDSDLRWPGQTANGGSAEPADRSYGWSGHTESVLPGHEDPDVTERFLRHQAEGLATREETDFWGQPLPQAPADLRIPAATPRAEEPAVTRTSWTAAADTTRPVAEPAHRTATVPAHPASAQQVSTGPVSTGPSSTGPLSTGVSQTQAAARQRDHRHDRYFPARLLAVIVIAALIGSALVLLLK